MTTVAQLQPDLDSHGWKLRSTVGKSNEWHYCYSKNNTQLLLRSRGGCGRLTNARLVIPLGLAIIRALVPALAGIRPPSSHLQLRLPLDAVAAVVRAELHPDQLQYGGARHDRHIHYHLT